MMWSVDSVTGRGEQRTQMQRVDVTAGLFPKGENKTNNAEAKQRASLWGNPATVGNEMQIPRADH